MSTVPGMDRTIEAAGSSGATAAVGSSGVTAAAGSSGATAAAGSSGATAAAGSSGVTAAAVGSPGAAATVGSSGATAAAGSSGVTAAAGSSGATGAVGSSGATAADPRPSLVRLTGIELRKSIDTRSGRVLLAAVLGLGVAALGYELTHLDGSAVGLEDFLGTALQGVLIVLPVIGTMAMTAEWTQRTALSTLTLTPHRGRVLSAKLLAGLALATIMFAVVTALTAVALVAAGLQTGAAPSWDDAGSLLAGGLLACLLQVLMAAGFGALIPETAAAVTLFLIAPTLWANAGPALLGDRADWVGVFAAIDRVANLDTTDAARTATALLVWIAIPLVAGLVASMRREVK